MLKTWSTCAVLLFSNLMLEANPLSPGTPVVIHTGTSTPVSVAATAGITVAVFVDTMSTIIPYRSTDNGSTWTASLSTLSSDAVTPAWATWNTNFMTTWLDPNMLSPQVQSSASNTGNLWTSNPPIHPGTNAGTLITVAGNSLGFVAGWKDTSINQPQTAFSMDNGMSWIASIPIPTLNMVEAAVMIGANSHGFLAAWLESDLHPYASFSSNGTSWSMPVQITGVGNPPRSDICVSGTAAGFMATWGDDMGFAFSSFSSDNGATWSTPSQIAINVTGNSDVTVSGSDVGFVAAWIDGTDHNAYASFSADHGAHWSAPVQVGTQISTNGYAPYHDFIGVTVLNDSCFFTWHESTMDNAMSNFSKIVSSTPPASITGSQHKNNFGLQYELVNLVQWGASTAIGVAGYNIYRDGTKIASVNSSTLQYEDHNRKKGVATTYAVTSFDASGNESSPVSTTIN